jgi:hypothetical protein
MAFGAAVLDSAGSTHLVGPFKLSPPVFAKDGDVRNFNPPMDLGTFPISKETDQIFVCAVQYCEDDGHGFAETIPGLMSTLLESVKTDVTSALTQPGQQSPSLGDILSEISTIVSLLNNPVDGLIQILGDLLSQIVSDEPLPAKTFGVKVQSAANPFGTGSPTSAPQIIESARNGTLQFGRYKMTFRWTAL